jgi:hypothetical protein
LPSGESWYILQLETGTALHNYAKRGIPMPYQTWLIVAIIFFYFAFVFWRFSNEPIRYFKFRRRSEAKEDEKGDSEVELLPEDFLHDFEGYLEAINRLNKVRFRLSAGGFLVSGVTALVAIFLG